MVKVISLSDSAYALLRRIKGERSFSETVLAAFKHGEADLMEVFGKWPGSREELTKIERAITADRKKFKLKEVSF